MAYNKTTWVNNVTPANETNLNNIENGVALGNTVFTVGGTADALTVTGTGLTDVSAAVINIEALSNNTGAVTLNIDGIGAVAIKKNITDDLEADDLEAGKTYLLKHDGTNWQVDISSAGGYWTLIDTITLTGASINIPVPSGYDEIKVETRGASASVSTNVALRVNNQTSNIYKSVPSSSTVGSFTSSINLGSISTSANLGDQSFIISNGSGSYKLGRTLRMNNNPDTFLDRNLIQLTSEISSLQAFVSSGNFTGGTIKIYGGGQ